jgi:hypothetical protein
MRLSEYGLNIVGNITATGSCCSSDRRLKCNIAKIDSSLIIINRLQGVIYDWDWRSFPNRNFLKDRQIGLIAQDVEKVLPEVVHEDSDGYKSLSYDKLTVVLIEAIKELKKENDNLKESIDALENK